MYELEVNHQCLSMKNIPVDVISAFSQKNISSQAMALLPWEEHCTECAMPACYSTCNMYEARKDGKCRRFIGGITPVSGINNYQGYITRISFKRWGQLMAYANLHAIPASRITWLEKITYWLDSIISRIPDWKLAIRGRSGLSSRMARRIKQFVLAKGLFGKSMQALPEYLLIEIFNPNSFTVKLTLTVSSRDPNTYNPGYQKLLEIEPGFVQFKVATEEIAQRQNLSENFNIILNPNILNEEDEGLTLYFGMLTFVWNKQAMLHKNKKKPHIKVVVWDLDNTLWKGILIEDGIDNIELMPGIVDVIKELDRRGILNSVVSKNNHDDAMLALDKFGLSEYMLYPQIGWNQKGLYIKSLVKQFNVAENTFAFIDDQPFERDEVSALNPQIRTYDAIEFTELLERNEFNPPTSPESHLRRELYKTAKQRDDVLSEFDGNYVAFLKECEIKLSIYTPESENIGRIVELVQRTNQLNFSGNRYSIEEIKEILSSEKYDTYCLDCEDRYGHYGTVGFGIVDNEECRLIDLMFSCRVQSKRVEHAFFSFLLKYYKNQSKNIFFATYIKTDRNMKAGAVFKDMQFTFPKNSSSHTYTFDLNNEIFDDKIINLLWNGKEC